MPGLRAGTLTQPASFTGIVAAPARVAIPREQLLQLLGLGREDQRTEQLLARGRPLVAADPLPVDTLALQQSDQLVEAVTDDRRKLERHVTLGGLVQQSRCAHPDPSLWVHPVLGLGFWD